MAKSQVKGSKRPEKKPPSNTGTEARSSYLLTAVAGGFAVTIVRNETQRHSAVLKSVGQNPIGLLTLDRSSFAVPSFRFHPLLRTNHQLRPRGVIAGGLRADLKSSSKPGTRHSGGGKIYRYETPNHVLTMGAYPNTKMTTIPTGSTYFM